jgi:hypothetical protein
MSVRSILPIIILLLLLPSAFDLSAAPAGDHGLTVKWTRTYPDENISYVDWQDEKDQVVVYSEETNGSSYDYIVRWLNATTGNVTSYSKDSGNDYRWPIDIDGDGQNESIVQTPYWLPHDNYTISIYRNGQAVPYATYTSNKAGEFVSPMQNLGDVNGNGYQDIVLDRYMLNETLPDPSGRNRVFYDKRIEVRDGKDLSVIWGLDLDNITNTGMSGYMNYVPPFDSNSDGVKDMLFFFPTHDEPTTYVQTGYCIDGKTGKFLWKTSTDWAAERTYFIDVNQDGTDELLIVWYNNSVWNSNYVRFEIRKLDGTLVPHPVLGYGRIPGKGELVDLGDHRLVYFTANVTDSTHMRYELRDFLTWKPIFSVVLEGKDHWYPFVQYAHDYNLDGVPEWLIVGSTDYILDGKTNKVLWSGPFDVYDRAFSYPFVGIYTYTRTPYFQFPQILKSIRIEYYDNGTVIWDGPKNGILVFGDIRDLHHDKDVEFLMAMRSEQSNGALNGTVTMFEIPKSLTGPPVNPPTNPPDKRTSTMVAQCMWPWLALVLLLVAIALITVRRLRERKRP